MYCMGVFPGRVEGDCMDGCVPGLCDDRRDAHRYHRGTFFRYVQGARVIMSRVGVTLSSSGWETRRGSVNPAWVPLFSRGS